MVFWCDLGCPWKTWWLCWHTWSEMVAVLIFVLISLTWKLISGQVIPATQFNFQLLLFAVWLPLSKMNDAVALTVLGWLGSDWWCLCIDFDWFEYDWAISVLSEMNINVVNYFFVFCTDFKGTFKLLYNARTRTLHFHPRGHYLQNMQQCQ